MSAAPKPSGAILPGNACDCAIHVYDPQFALSPTATFTPPVAPLSDYLDQCRSVGLERVVIAQPSAYGFDNRCTLEAMRRHGTGARGLAVIPPQSSAADIRKLDEQGMRGIRYMLFPGGALPIDDLDAISMAIASLDWHINLRMPLHLLPSIEHRLRRLPTRFVIDLDLGCHTPLAAMDDCEFRCLQGLLHSGRTWIKLAAPYKIWLGDAASGREANHIEDAFIRSFPERCLWASNWPHPNIAPSPSMTRQVGWAMERMSQATIRRIFVDNPAEIYGF